MNTHERSVSDKGLTIRPHHLAHYYGFAKNFSRFGDESVALLRREYTAATLNQLNQPNRWRLRQRAYLRDILGTTTVSALAGVDGFMQINQDYIDGDDDMPVKIALEKDRICIETCAIGKHCNVMKKEIEEDYTGQFLVMASTAGVEVESDYGDAIHTDLGTLKYIFNHDIQNQS